MHKNEIKHIILSFLYKHKFQSFPTRKVFFACGIPKSDSAIFEKVLLDLHNNECVHMENSTVKWNDNCFLSRCSVFGTRYYAYNDGEKYRLSFSDSVKPLDGDFIVAKIDDRFLLEATILEISARTNKCIIGTLNVKNEVGFVVPDNRNKYFYDIYVGSGKFLIPMENAKVEVALNRFDTKKKPCGTITRFIRDVIEDAEENAPAFLAKNGVVTRIPEAVLEEAGKIKDRISRNNYPAPNNYTNRILVDDRDVFIIGNGESADLAYSARSFANGYEVDFFVPDVAEIIQEGCKLDKFAFNRCFDTGFGGNLGSVFPKELLDEKICFKVGKKRLAVGCRLYLNESLEITSHEFYEGIIKACERIPSKELNKYKQNPTSEFEADYSRSLEIVMFLRDLICANKYLDDMPLSDAIDTYARAIYDKLACREIAHARAPMLFRCSEKAGEVASERFVYQCKNLGLSECLAEKVTEEPFNLYDLLDTVKSYSVKKALKKNFEGVLPIEDYSEVMKPNFRRGYFDCRVSSPTTSHPDLFNQRILKRIIKKTIGNENVLDNLRNTLPKISENYNKAEYRARRAREEYNCALRAREIRHDAKIEGIVYNITPAGVHILCKGGSCGLLRFDDYELSDTEMRYVTESGEEGLLHIGDAVFVTFDWLDMKNRRIIFKLAEEENDEGKEEKA